MKKTILTTSLIFLFCALIGQNSNPDSTTIEELKSKLESLQNNYEQLAKDAQNLQSSLINANNAINDLITDQKLSDSTKWVKVKSSIISNVKAYRLLNSDIIALKSRLNSEDYQAFVNGLGSIKNESLGFSFDEVIIKKAKEIGLYQKESKLEKFISVAKNVISSPIISNIPYVSEAVSISNSILDIAYSGAVSERAPDLTKFNTFEADLNRYISYYNALDAANLINQAGISGKILLLKNLQIDLLNAIKKNAVRFNISLEEKNENESLDSYLNGVISQFNETMVEKYLKSIESKYEDSSVVNYKELLKKELDIKYINNNVGETVALSKKFRGYYEDYFDLSNNYNSKVIEALNIARKQNIIVAQEGKTVEEIYNGIVTTLNSKQVTKDDGLRNTINIQELENQINLLESESVRVF